MSTADSAPADDGVPVPDWVTPGAPAILIISGMTLPRATATTIERLTKRDVVLTNGVRVRRDGLYSRTGNRGMTRLVQVGSEQAVHAIARWNQHVRKRRVMLAIRAWETAPTLETCGLLVDAIQATLKDYESAST